MKESADAAEGAGRDIGESFDKFGEGAGSAEQKFIGFKDSLSGVVDIKNAFKADDFWSRENFMNLASGMADLAGAGEALWASFGKVATQIGKKIAATAADTATTIANTAATVAHSVATFAVEAATKAWTAAQWLLNAALAANPIVLIIIGLAALTAGIILAWQHSETFRNIVTGAFNAVWGVIQAVWGWISTNFPKLLGYLTAPFRSAWDFISGIFTTINDAATGARDWVLNRFTDLTNFMIGLPGRILNALGNLGGLLRGIGRDIIQGLWNGFIDKWNEVSGWLGGIGGKIKSLKGPIEQDRVLLVDEGKAIMEGLGSGLEAGWQGVRAYVQQISGQIVQDFNAITQQTMGGSGQTFISKLGTVLTGQRALISNTQQALFGDTFDVVNTSDPGARRALIAAGMVEGRDGKLYYPQNYAFADGAFVRGGRGGVNAMIGEGRNDELVLPLDRFSKGGLGTTINLTVNVPPTANPVDTGREIRRVLNRYDRTLVTR